MWLNVLLIKIKKVSKREPYLSFLPSDFLHCPRSYRVVFHKVTLKTVQCRSSFNRFLLIFIPIRTHAVVMRPSYIINSCQQSCSGKTMTMQVLTEDLNYLVTFRTHGSFNFTNVVKENFFRIDIHGIMSHLTFNLNLIEQPGTQCTYIFDRLKVKITPIFYFTRTVIGSGSN